MDRNSSSTGYTLAVDYRQIVSPIENHLLSCRNSVWKMLHPPPRNEPNSNLLQTGRNVIGTTGGGYLRLFIFGNQEVGATKCGKDGDAHRYWLCLAFAQGGNDLGPMNEFLNRLEAFIGINSMASIFGCLLVSRNVKRDACEVPRKLHRH